MKNIRLAFCISTLVSVVACGGDGGSAAVRNGHDAGTTGGSGSGGAQAGGGSSGIGNTAGTGGGGRASGPRDAGLDGTSVAVLIDCDPDSSTVSSAADPGVGRRVRGSNGAFEDRCDPGGNLVKFACEVLFRCGPGPNPGCAPYYSGLVRPALVDCAGQCRNGACDDRCPSQGQAIVYESTDGAGYFVARNETDGERYQCTVIFDNDRDSFDCIKNPHVGDEANIDGTSNGTCEAEFPLAVVVKGSDAAPGAAQCTLSCRRMSGDLGPASVGAPPPVTACPPAGQVASGPFVGSPDVRSLLTGTNGQFEDRCATDGNLVDYACDVTNASTGPPWHVYSGLVAASYYDCGGTCQAGACIGSCPTAGQALAFESAVTDSYLVVRNAAEGRRYGCVITWDDPNDSFDCTTGVRSGLTGSIVTLAGSGNQCTAQFAEIPVTFDGVAGSCSGCLQCKLSCRATR